VISCLSLDLLAPQAGLLGHDEGLERGPRLERAHEPEEPGAAGELGPADPVVHVDVGVGDRPALARGVGAGALDLAGDGPGVLGAAVLRGRLAGVDGSDHGDLQAARKSGRYPNT
jgi:hypothetical protein